LDTIKDLVYQDGKKKYHLTKIGEQAYRALNHNSDSLNAVQYEESLKNIDTNQNFRKNLLDYVLFKKIYLLMEKKPLFSIFIPILILFLNSLLCVLFNIELYLLFAFPVTDSPLSIFWSNMFQLGSVILGYLLLIFISDVLSRILFGKKSDWKVNVKYFSLCYIPILGYLILFGIFQDVPNFPQSFLNKIFVIIFQLWAIIILSFILSTKNLLKFERAVIISVFINYGSFLFVLFFKTSLYLPL
jgi:hypothetical protein